MTDVKRVKSELWTDEIKSRHRRVQFPQDPNASTVNTIEALRAQSEADREYIKVLRDAIEQVHNNYSRQMIDITAQSQRMDNIEATAAQMESEAVLTDNRIPERINTSVKDATDARFHTVAGEVSQFRQDLAASQTKTIELQAMIEKLDAERPADGNIVSDSFSRVDAEITGMNAILEGFSQRTEVQIAAVQGSAAPMPDIELQRLNVMYKELETMKAWSDAAATKVSQQDQQFQMLCTKLSMAASQDDVNNIELKMGVQAELASSTNDMVAKIATEQKELRTQVEQRAGSSNGQSTAQYVGVD